MAESNGPARAYLKVSYGGFSHGKVIEFYAGGDTPTEVHDDFVNMFGEQATTEAIGKLLDILTEDTTANATGNLQSQGMVDSGPRCAHGPRVRRDGVNAKGKWVGWFCPTPKGTPGQCKAEFE